MNNQYGIQIAKTNYTSTDTTVFTVELRDCYQNWYLEIARLEFTNQFMQYFSSPEEGEKCVNDFIMDEINCGLKKQGLDEDVREYLLADAREILNEENWCVTIGGVVSNTAPASAISEPSFFVNELPGVNNFVTSPCLCKGYSYCQLREAIIHLNDTHRWTREDIADWIDTEQEAGHINVIFGSDEPPPNPIPQPSSTRGPSVDPVILADIKMQVGEFVATAEMMKATAVIASDKTEEFLKTLKWSQE